MQLSISAMGGELGNTLQKDEILRDEDEEPHLQEDTLLKQLKRYRPASIMSWLNSASPQPGSHWVSEQLWRLLASLNCR